VTSTGALPDSKLQISDFKLSDERFRQSRFRFDGGVGFALGSRHEELHDSIRARDAFDRDSHAFVTASESRAAEKGAKGCAEQISPSCSAGDRKRY